MRDLIVLTIIAPKTAPRKKDGKCTFFARNKRLFPHKVFYHLCHTNAIALMTKAFLFFSVNATIPWAVITFFHASIIHHSSPFFQEKGNKKEGVPSFLVKSHLMAIIVIPGFARPKSSSPEIDLSACKISHASLSKTSHLSPAK